MKKTIIDLDLLFSNVDQIMKEIFSPLYLLGPGKFIIGASKTEFFRAHALFREHKYSVARSIFIDIANRIDPQDEGTGLNARLNAFTIDTYQKKFLEASVGFKKYFEEGRIFGFPLWNYGYCQFKLN